MSPCPYCNSPPDVGPCTGWPRNMGKPPWHVGCYRSGDREHYIGVNGDTKAEALENWEREVRDHKTVR